MTMLFSAGVSYILSNSEEQDKPDSVWSNPDKSGHPLQKKNRGRRGQILPKSDKGGQTFWKGKSPENRTVPGFLSIFELVCQACYLLEN